jgi:hypothetical protein
MYMINKYPKCLRRARRKREAELLNGLQVQECGVNNACLRIRGGRTMNRGLPADVEFGSGYGKGYNYKLNKLLEKGGHSHGMGRRCKDRGSPLKMHPFPSPAGIRA